MGALYEDVEKFFGDIFAAYGRFLARFPIVFIVLSLVTSLLLGLGLLSLKYENDVEKLYTPMGSPAAKDRIRLAQLFPDDTREDFYSHQMVHAGTYGELVAVPTGEDETNVLESDFVDELIRLEREIRAVTLEDDARGLHFEDVCAFRNGRCVVDGEFVLRTLQDNQGCLNTTLDFPWIYDTTDTRVDIRNTLSDITLENHCIQARAFRLRFNLRRDTDQQHELSILWEKRFLAVLSQFESPHLDLAYAASESLDLELAEHLGQDTKYFSLTIVIMVLYSIFVSSGGNWVSTRTLLAQAGVFAALLAILASFGLLSMCGMVFVDICGVMPFLILGVGVDDMFILMSGWRRTKASQSIQDRMGETFRTSAISVTITSLTNLLAFCIGATSPFLSVRNFCIYAGVAVMFCYINHLTFFAGWMVLNARRVMASRHCLACVRTKSRKSLKDEGIHSRLTILCCHGEPPQKMGENDSYCEKLPNTFLPRLLLLWPTKMVVLCLFVVYLGVSVWGASQLQIGLKLESVVPDHSYLYKYFAFEAKYFSAFGAPVMFAVTDTVDYSSPLVRNDISHLLKRARTMKFTDDEFQLSWLDQYVNFLVANRSVAPENPDFVRILREDFLPAHPEFQGDIKLSEDGSQIVASRFYIRSQHLNDSTVEGDMMLTMRAIANNSSCPIIAYSTLFIYYEHYVSILKNTLLAVGVAFIGMLFIALMFIPHAISITCVTFTMVTIVLGMFGFMHFWGLELSAITNVQIILSVGFCVDFTVHISHAFMTTTGKNRNERVIAALEKVGIPILNGAMSSVLGVLILAFAHSYVFRSFFKTMLLVILLGLAHSLFLLPIILSFIGPRRTSKPRVFIPISANWSGALGPAYSPKHLGEENIDSPPPPPPSAAGSKTNLTPEGLELMQLETPTEEHKRLLSPVREEPGGGYTVAEQSSNLEVAPFLRTLLDKTPEDEHFRLGVSSQEDEVKVEAAGTEDDEDFMSCAGEQENPAFDESRDHSRDHSRERSGSRTPEFGGGDLERRIRDMRQNKV